MLYCGAAVSHLFLASADISAAHLGWRMRARVLIWAATSIQGPGGRTRLDQKGPEGAKGGSTNENRDRAPRGGPGNPTVGARCSALRRPATSLARRSGARQVQ